MCLNKLKEARERHKDDMRKKHRKTVGEPKEEPKEEPSLLKEDILQVVDLSFL